MDNLLKSPCRDCKWCEYDTRYSPNGKAYRDFSCYFPKHWQVFGRRDADLLCPDFSPAESSMEAL